MAKRYAGFNRYIYILAFGRLVMSTGFAIFVPFLSLYFHNDLGISMTAVGLFFAYSTILRSVPQPFAGWLTDRFGRVPIMGWSQILRAMTFFGVAIAVYHDAGFWLIAGIISFNYIFGSVLQPAANAMVADLSKKEERIHAYALMRIAGNLGWALGPAAGGFIAHKSNALLFAASGLIAVLSGIFFLVALRHAPQVKTEDRTKFSFKQIFNLRKDKALFRHCLISFLLYLTIAQLIVALSVYGVNNVGLTKEQLGWLYFINGSMVVLFQFFISSALQNLPLTRQLAIGAAIYAIGYFAVGFANSFIFLIICIAVITTAEIIVSPPAVTLVANLSPAGKYGEYMGIFGFLQTAGWSLGPTYGGILLDLLSNKPVILWGMVAIMAAAAVFLYLIFGRQLPPDINSATNALTREPAHA